MVCSMKRSFLEELGIEKETIDKIMAENGNDIEKAKGSLADVQKERDDLKAQVSERDNQLEELKKASGNADELKAQIEQLQKDNHNIKVNAAIEKALTSAKAKNIKAVKALLSLDEAELSDDGSIKGLTEQIEAVKKDNDYLFEAVEKPKKPEIKGVKPAESNDDKAGEGKSTKDMSYDELCEYLNDHSAEDLSK